jgi:hypothetical protein
VLSANVVCAAIAVITDLLEARDVASDAMDEIVALIVIQDVNQPLNDIIAELI